MGVFGNKKKCACSPMADVLMYEGTKNSANALFASIRFREMDSRLHSIAVTSGVPNEGKSTVSAALASAIGASGHRCLLVDADLRHRGLSNAFDMRSQYGLCALFSRECTIEQAVNQTRFENVAFLSAEESAPAPEIIFGSERFGTLMAALAEQYDYVIYDTTSLQSCIDGAVVASRADGTVLVLREDFTERSEVLQSVSILQDAHAKLLGTVINGQKG